MIRYMDRMRNCENYDMEGRDIIVIIFRLIYMRL